MVPLTLLRTMEKIPLATSTFVTLVCPVLALSTLTDETHDIPDIDMNELMQAAMSITKKAIRHVVKQTLRIRIHPGSIMNGSSSS